MAATSPANVALSLADGGNMAEEQAGFELLAEGGSTWGLPEGDPGQAAVRKPLAPEIPNLPRPRTVAVSGRDSSHLLTRVSAQLRDLDARP